MSQARVSPALRRAWNLLTPVEGPNDGMVSITSASYGEHTDIWHGDHLSLINWPNPQACALGVWRSRVRQGRPCVARQLPVRGVDRAVRVQEGEPLEHLEAGPLERQAASGPSAQKCFPFRLRQS